MMQREKQIEEMAYEIETRLGYLKSTCYNAANVLYHAGYRKQIEAEWKQAYNSYARYFCTHCNHLYNNKLFKYCPNCGAKMKR